jgi:polyferredoxin
VKYLTLFGTYLKKVEVRDLIKLKEIILVKLKNFTKIKQHITKKHLYVTAIVFFQLLSLFSLSVNIYYVVTFIVLYTICSIALFVHLYKLEIHKNGESKLKRDL